MNIFSKIPLTLDKYYHLQENVYIGLYHFPLPGRNICHGYGGGKGGRCDELRERSNTKTFGLDMALNSEDKLKIYL